MELLLKSQKILHYLQSKLAQLSFFFIIMDYFQNFNEILLLR